MSVALGAEEDEMKKTTASPYFSMISRIEEMDGAVLTYEEGEEDIPQDTRRARHNDIAVA